MDRHKQQSGTGRNEKVRDTEQKTCQDPQFFLLLHGCLQVLPLQLLKLPKGCTLAVCTNNTGLALYQFFSQPVCLLLHNG